MSWIRKGLMYIINELADGIERSTIGTLIMLVCLGYTGYLVFTEGGSETVESLILAAYVVGSALLGLNVVFDKGGRSGDDSPGRSSDKEDSHKKSGGGCCGKDSGGSTDWRSFLK